MRETKTIKPTVGDEQIVLTYLAPEPRDGAVRLALGRILAERDALREALERIVGMCDGNHVCACGRKTGVLAVQTCATNALRAVGHVAPSSSEVVG